MNAALTVFSTQTPRPYVIDPSVPGTDHGICYLKIFAPALLISWFHWIFIQQMLTEHLHAPMTSAPTVDSKCPSDSKTQYVRMHVSFIFWKWWFEGLNIRQMAEYIASGIYSVLEGLPTMWEAIGSILALKRGAGESTRTMNLVIFTKNSILHSTQYLIPSELI